MRREAAQLEHRERRGSIGLKRGRHPSEDARQSLQFRTERSLGNQTVGALYQPGPIQAKLKVGAPNDRFEQEADRVADQVMRMPLPDSANLSPAPHGVQRSCAACAGGGAPCAKCGGEEEIRRKPLASGITPLGQHRPSAKAHPAGAGHSDAVPGGARSERLFRSLSGGGRPLPASQRSFFEPRFGLGFSDVRIHTGNQATEMARHVSARAFTLGRNVVFGASQYEPDTPGGRRLLAHELTHVAQQGHARSPASGPVFGTATPMMAKTDAPVVQRKLQVDPNASIPLPPGLSGPPEPLTNAVQGLIDDTCPQGNFQVDPSTGNVTATQSLFGTTPGGFCAWPGVPYDNATLRADLTQTPVGCRCLCDVVNNSRNTTIDFRAGGPSTSPELRGGVRRGFTGTGRGSPTVNIDTRFQGQYRIAGRWVDVPFHLLFAHELCGHALPLMQGTHVPVGAGPAGGTPPHEVHSVDMERRIAAEQSPPLPRRPSNYAGAARQRP